MKLAEARQLADDMKASVEKGEDPFADRARDKTAKTFKDLAAEYIERHAKPKKKTWREDQRVLDKELLPKWRHLRPVEIKRADVRERIEAVADRGSPIHANRLLAVIRKIFNFAIERDWLEYNPCHMVKRPGKERPRDRVLMPDEIRRFWAATEVEPPPIRARLAPRGSSRYPSRSSTAIGGSTGMYTVTGVSLPPKAETVVPGTSRIPR